MNLFFKLGLLALLSISGSVYAQGVDFADVFSIPPTDVSQTLLGFIFGQVEGVLLGGGSLLLGKMFGIFNSVVLALGGIVILYTLVVSTLNTAHEGEVMGRKWSSMWIPVRSAMGVALLLPKASGYSIIQILTMWIVLQGVGAGDTIWFTVVDYLNETGTGTSVNIAADGNLDDLQRAIGNLLINVGCKRAINHVAGTNLIVQSPGSITANVREVKFGGGKNSGIPDDFCGAVSWNPSPDVDPGVYATAMTLLLSALDQSAVQLINDSDNTTYTIDSTMAIINPSLNFIQAVTTGTSLTTGEQEQLISDERRDAGWITAGFYYNLINERSLRAQRSSEATIPTVTAAGRAPDFSRIAFYGSEANRYLDTITTFVDNFLEDMPASGALPDSNLGIGVKFNCGAPSSMKIGHTIIDTLICKGFKKVTNAFTDIANAPPPFMADPSADPVIYAQHLGQAMLAFVLFIWLIGAASVFLIALLTAVNSSVNPLPTAILAVINWIVPLLMTLAGILFVAGATLAYYVPLIPFFLFLFGALGWFMSVIEAMIAAPLVALGVLHPEGHEVMGEAKPALLLITSVFLRPSLMIFGLVTAISLTMVGVALLNYGFMIVVMNILFGSGTPLTIISLIAIFIIYAVMVVVVTTFCFKMINNIPNRVLRWIGGSVEGYGEEQALGDIKGGFQQGMEGVGKMADTGISKGMEGGAAMGGAAGKAMGNSGGGGGASPKGGGGGGAAAGGQAAEGAEVAAAT